MTAQVIKIIAFFTLISLAAMLFILWLVDFSPFNIPEFLPVLEVRIYGILILISFILTFIFLQKRLLKLNIDTSIWELILASAVVSFISLFLYQVIRQLIILRGQYDYDFSSVLLSWAAPSIVSTMIAASVSVELKKVKGIWRHVPTILLLILVLLIKQYAHKIEW